MEEHKFVRDDDCHWYIIPVSSLDAFYAALEYGEQDEYDRFNRMFGPFRSADPSRYAFTSWRHM